MLVNRRLWALLQSTDGCWHHALTIVHDGDEDAVLSNERWRLLPALRSWNDAQRQQQQKHASSAGQVQCYRWNERTEPSVDE